MENLILFACGLLGVFLQCCIKANSLIIDAQKANIKFTVKDYISKDFLAITMSVAMILVWFLIFGEVGQKNPKILDYVRVTFVLMGLVGSYLIQAIFNKSKSYIRGIIDRKTDIADNVVMDVPDDIGGSNPPPIKGDK